jgi:hypothetical protein
MNYTLVNIFFIFNISLSYAGFGTRGGGEAVVCKKNNQTTVELFDFYEAPALYTFSLEGKLATDLSVDERVLKKLEQIGQYDMVFAFNLKDEYEIFKNRHNKVETAKISEAYDSGSVVKVDEKCEKRQFAINRLDASSDEYMYLIDKDLWNLADNRTKAALILHEIIYISKLKSYRLASEEILERLKIAKYLSTSYSIRYYNAYIHSAQFGSTPYLEYRRTIRRLHWLHHKNMHALQLILGGGLKIIGKEFINR